MLSLTNLTSRKKNFFLIYKTIETVKYQKIRCKKKLIPSSHLESTSSAILRVINRSLKLNKYFFLMKKKKSFFVWVFDTYHGH